MSSRPAGFALAAAIVGAVIGMLFACATAGRFAGPDPTDPCTTARAGQPPFEGANLANGEQVYAAQCAECHALPGDSYTRRRSAPPLDGILSRQVGGLDSFRYSKAFRDRQLDRDRGDAWTLDSLDRYIEDPEWFVPGTRMAYAGLADANARRDLIAFLSCAGPQRAVTDPSGSRERTR